MGCLISFIFPAVLFLKVMETKSGGKCEAKVSTITQSVKLYLLLTPPLKYLATITPNTFTLSY